MLSLADRPIEDVIAAFARHGLQCGLLVPTQTGLSKSIMDAHGQVREYLRSTSFHDYESQGQGPEYKVEAPAYFVTPIALVQTTVSLYRPRTKDGDPRIWFHGLGRLCAAGNVLALLVLDGACYVVNASNPAVLGSIDSPSTPLGKLAAAARGNASQAAERLLAKIRDIASRGYVPTLRAGPTGVGMTLETLLGISANSSRLPDFEGIEIKATRTTPRGRASTRTTLFSLVPNWSESACRSATELLQRHGYDRGEGLRLYCSVNHRPNAQGLYLSVDDEWLHVLRDRGSASEKVVRWRLSDLRRSLSEKHQQTFWVSAKRKLSVNGLESFHYHRVLRTGAPLVSNLEVLLQAGKVELDFLLKVKASRSSGEFSVRDHGYLFKIHSRDNGLLFGDPVSYAFDEQ